MHRVKSCYKLTLEEIDKIEKVISGTRLIDLPQELAMEKIKNSMKYLLEIVTYLELLEDYYKKAHNKETKELTTLIQDFNKELSFLRKNALIEETRIRKDLSKGELLIQEYGNQALFEEMEDKIRTIVIRTKQQIQRMRLELY